MEKKLLLGDEAIALGAIHAGLSGVYAYPGTPSTEITEFIQTNQIAKERGIHSARYVVHGQARFGVYEARGNECLCRPVRQLSHDGGQRRRSGACCRRPVDALFAGRTGLALLWPLCHDTRVRTQFAAGSLRHDGFRVRLFRAAEASRADARHHSHGSLACSGQG